MIKKSTNLSNDNEGVKQSWKLGVAFSEEERNEDGGARNGLRRASLLRTQGRKETIGHRNKAGDIIYYIRQLGPPGGVE